MFNKKVTVTGFGCSNSCCRKEKGCLLRVGERLRLHTDKGLQRCCEKLLMVKAVRSQVYHKCRPTFGFFQVSLLGFWRQ